jgi:hypothetical protein
LARLHSSRSRASDPTTAVPDGSASVASKIPATTLVRIAWSIWSPEKSGTRTVSPMGASFAAASTRVMLVPLPPKSHSTITPDDGRPGSDRSAVSAAVASETTGDRLSPGLVRNAARNVSTTGGRQ